MKQRLTKPMPKQLWTIDKRVPLALIVMLMVQTAGAIWWAATISGRVDQLEKSQRQTDESKLGERMVKVEVLVQQVVDSTQRIERQLTRRER